MAGDSRAASNLSTHLSRDSEVSETGDEVHTEGIPILTAQDEGSGERNSKIDGMAAMDSNPPPGLSTLSLCYFNGF